MKNKKFTISGLFAFLLWLLLGLAATSFAGMGVPDSNPAVGTEAGAWELDFDAPLTKADIAAQYPGYDQENLALVGTEAGVDVIASCKARTAAEIIDYNTELLALVGTEAGHNPYGVSLDGGYQGLESTTMEHVVERDSQGEGTLYRC